MTAYKLSLKEYYFDYQEPRSNLERAWGPNTEKADPTGPTLLRLNFVHDSISQFLIVDQVQAKTQTSKAMRNVPSHAE